MMFDIFVKPSAAGSAKVRRAFVFSGYDGCDSYRIFINSAEKKNFSMRRFPRLRAVARITKACYNSRILTDKVIA